MSRESPESKFRDAVSHILDEWADDATICIECYDKAWYTPSSWDDPDLLAGVLMGLVSGATTDPTQAHFCLSEGCVPERGDETVLWYQSDRGQLAPEPWATSCSEERCDGIATGRTDGRPMCSMCLLTWEDES